MAKQEMAEAEGEGEADGSVTEVARAKVNLTLRVLGRRADGYHELESLVVFADIGDVVELTFAAAPAVSSHGPFGTAIPGDDLVAQTVSRLIAAEPRLHLGTIAIEKNLPVAAGLGGGSADAAAALRALMRANPAFADKMDWRGLAAGLGADVPVCLANEPSLMWGIGEKVRPVTGLPLLHAVLVYPGTPARPDKTREVFRRLAAPAAPAQRTDPAPLPAFAGASDLIAYLHAHGNDLAAPARDLMPATSEVEAALAACSDCRLVRMSGAGPTTYGLFDTAQAAQSASRALTLAHPGWWVRAVRLG